MCGADRKWAASGTTRDTCLIRRILEPAKWLAKLRELKTDNNKLLFKINMEAGHGGASGRFDYLKDIAWRYAFLLALEGKQE